MRYFPWVQVLFLVGCAGAVEGQDITENGDSNGRTSYGGFYNSSGGTVSMAGTVVGPSGDGGVFNALGGNISMGGTTIGLPVNGGASTGVCYGATRVAGTMAPVCGTDGKVYGLASCIPVPIACYGFCPCPAGIGGASGQGGATTGSGGTGGASGTFTPGSVFDCGASGRCVVGQSYCGITAYANPVATGGTAPVLLTSVGACAAFPARCEATPDCSCVCGENAGYCTLEGFSGCTCSQNASGELYLQCRG